MKILDVLLYITGFATGSACLFTLVALFWRRKSSYQYGSDKTRGWAVGWAIGCGALAAITCVLWLIILGDLNNSKDVCREYSKSTGRETTFKVLSGWGTWDCFTPASDGKQVSIDQIGDYNK